MTQKQKDRQQAEIIVKARVKGLGGFTFTEMYNSIKEIGDEFNIEISTRMVAMILKDMGYEKVRVRVGKDVVRGYRRVSTNK